jgi:hypothetical protein
MNKKRNQFQFRLRPVAWCTFFLCGIAMATAQTPPASSTPVPAPAETTASASASTPFQHPGLLNNREEFDFIKAKVAAGEEPWASAFARLEKSPFANLNWTPKPRDIVNVGYFGKPDNGGWDELRDATSAYVHALIWVVTGREEHARKSAEILDAWADQLQTHTGDNALVQAAWAGCDFPLSAEILRSTYPAWGKDKSDKFAAMLKRAFVPLIFDGKPTFNGNWELSMCDALMAIGVFADDRSVYEQGVNLWRKRVPAYLYISSDGALPVAPAAAKFKEEQLIQYWHKPSRFVDGLCQETGRDFPHLQMGLGALISAAEIAYHQGLDLYGEDRERITAAMEFHAKYLLGEPIPEWLFGGKLDLGKGAPAMSTWEMAYNHFHNRLGMELPYTRRFILEKVRLIKDVHPFHQAGADCLTHAELSVTPNTPAK